LHSYDKIELADQKVMMRFLTWLVKIRIIHCKRYDLIGGIIFATLLLFAAYTQIAFKIPASREQAGAEPVIAGITIFMFLFISGFVYWSLSRDKLFYLSGQYEKYEVCGNDSGINKAIELSGSGEFELTIEVIWKVRKEDIPPDRSFRLAGSRKDNGVRAHINMEIVSDNSSRQLFKFEQQPDDSLNAGKIAIGKTLDTVAVSCVEKVSINITAQVERKEEKAIEHEEIFLIRVYNSLSLKEAFQPVPNMISFD
jgi:hypothetical protein